MPQRKWLITFYKGLAAWLFLSLSVWYFQAWLGKGLCLLSTFPLTLMTTEISPLVKLTQTGADYSLELSAWVLRPIPINADMTIPPGTELKSSTHLLHILVPVIIEWSVLLVWPVQRWTQRLLLIGTGILSAVVLVLATLPATLLGLLEISFQQVAVLSTEPRPVPWFLDWMIFCELGGAWLLAIIGAWLCIQLQQKLLCR
jgi:hypothetical protein